MLKEQDKITIEELKAYLYSLEDEQTKEKAIQINEYKKACEEDQREVKDKEIQKIEKNIDKEYERRNQTKDEILSLLDECDEIPDKMERLEIAKYMLYRVDIRSAENVIEKAIKKLEKRYNGIVDEIIDRANEFTELDNIQEIDFSMYKTNRERLNKIKEEFKEEYTKEQRKSLIQNELDIIEKTKIFNTTPIPHEILKNSDRDIQIKMPKFNNVRQKRLKIINTMEADYIKLAEPREIDCMIDDANLNIKTISDILTKSEYDKVKNKLAKTRKKLYRSTSEIRNIIKSKEKKTGIINYSIQEARYARMEVLRTIILDATNVIKANEIPDGKEKLEKLENMYNKEKQFASVIEKIAEESGTNPETNVEIKNLEEQILKLKQAMENSKKIIAEQEEKIEKAKKELLILWKIEIDSTISKKRDMLELPEKATNSSEFIKEKNNKIKSIFKLKKMHAGKHASV